MTLEQTGLRWLLSVFGFIPEAMTTGRADGQSVIDDLWSALDGN